MPDDIEGFDYEMGFTYQLDIEESYRDDPNSGDQVLQRTLVQVLSKKEDEEDTDYWINLDANSAPITVSDEQYYLQGYSFSCSPLLDCSDFFQFDTIDDWTLENIALTLVFKYKGAGVIELDGGGFIN